MLKHVVVSKYKKGVSESAIADMEKGLAALPQKIPEIKQFQWGRDVLHSETSYDFALVSAFENLDALRRYQVNSAHQEIAAKLREICDSLILVDFES